MLNKFSGPSDPNGDKDMQQRLMFAVTVGKNELILKNGDVAVVVAGFNVDTGNTNTIRIVTISDNMESMFSG